MNQPQKRGVIRKAGLFASLAGASLVLAGCGADNGIESQNDLVNNIFKFGLPYGVTPEAAALREFWMWVIAASMTIGVIMWAVMFWSMAMHRASRHSEEFPRQTGYNVPLELVLTTIPVIIVSLLFVGTVFAQDKATNMEKDPGVIVDVTGFQWNWKFGYNEISDTELSPTGQLYSGVDEEKALAAREVELSRTEANIHGEDKLNLNYLVFNEVETLGTTDEVPVLVLPVNTAIQFDLASADVVHSFWVPEFLFKRDVFPFPEQNKSVYQFQIEEITTEGAYVGRCAEMCGTYHAMMNFEIRVVSREDFQAYMQFRVENPQATNADALAAIGQEPYSTSTSPFVSDRLGTRGTTDQNTFDLNATY